MTTNLKQGLPTSFGSGRKSDQKVAPMASLGFSYVNNGQQKSPGLRSKSRGGPHSPDQMLRDASGGTWQPALMPQLPDRIDRIDSDEIGRSTRNGVFFWFSIWFTSLSSRHFCHGSSCRW